MRSASGQATIDYVALVAVLAIVFAVALGPASAGAAGIVNAVTGQIRYALCVVGGGPCTHARSKPCTVASSRDTRHVGVSLVIVRIDHDRYVLRERMSDGTVRLTLSSGWAAGGEGGLGARARLKAGGMRIATGEEARVAAQLAYVHGTTYVARDERQAQSFMRAIDDGRAPGPPREVVDDGGVRTLAEAGIGSAWIEGGAGTMLGARRDRRSGEVTIGLASSGTGWAALAAAGAAPAGAADRAATLSLTLDRHHRARELAISASGHVAGGVALPLALKRVLAESHASAMFGRRWEVTARLDLRDPLVQDAWARLRRSPASGRAIGALARAIRDRAYLDVRAYRTDSTTSGGGAAVALGARIGGEYDHTIDEARLVAASSRPPAGLWERRLDCVAA